MNDYRDPAMMIERLRQLQPASATDMQARVFYALGYAAGQRVALKRSAWKQRLVAAACLCLAIGSGALVSRHHMGFVDQPSAVLPLEETMSTGGVDRSGASDSEVQRSAIRNEDTADPEPTIERLGSPLAPLASLVAAWSADQAAMRHGFRIAPIGTEVEQIITFESPRRRSNATSAAVVPHPFSDLIDVEQTQANRIKQFLDRLL